MSTTFSFHTPILSDLRHWEPSRRIFSRQKLAHRRLLILSHGSLCNCSDDPSNAYTNSHVVQWLGSGVFTAMARVQFPAWERVFSSPCFGPQDSLCFLLCQRRHSITISSKQLMEDARDENWPCGAIGSASDSRSEG